MPGTEAPLYVFTGLQVCVGKLQAARSNKSSLLNSWIVLLNKNIFVRLYDSYQTNEAVIVSLKIFYSDTYLNPDHKDMKKNI